jgi:S-DNA-T family DNA segregation ATPase FtsK/SpoIIIE
MAKRKKTSARGSTAPRKSIVGAFSRVLLGLWRILAKSFGSSVRFVFRGAKELDPAHQRDGIAFLILIFSLVSAAGTWFHLNNFVGRELRSILFGGVGRLAYLVPVILVYFAVRLFKSPDEGAATGRITIGTIFLLLTSSGLIHIFNGSVGDTGKSSMQGGGGWLGYGVSTPLVALTTNILAVPILLLIFFFGLLVVTATPFSRIIDCIKALFHLGKTKANERRAARELTEEFEIQ